MSIAAGQQEDFTAVRRGWWPSFWSRPRVKDEESNLEEVEVGFERRSGNAVAFLVSLVLHTTFLLVLACWAYTAGKPSQGLLLSANIGESADTSLDTIQTFELVPEFESNESEIVDRPLDLELDLSVATPLESAAVGVGQGNPSIARLSIGDVAERLRKKTEGAGRGASFFGTYAEGNRFIYVLDSSRSMKGDRWTYACQQLVDSLNGLKLGQEFLVICFDMETTFLFNKPPAQAEFQDAGKSSVTRVRRWLRSRSLGDATMPAQALRYALEMNPDAIFLLSDGELQDNSLVMLRMINGNVSERRQIPIHTVHLFSWQGRATLRQIAQENQGTFRPIEKTSRFGEFSRR